MSLLGIDIGNNNCKIATRSGSGIKLISERMPNNMVRDGQVVTPDSMAQFLKMVRKQGHVRDRNCALVLSPTQMFFRHVTLPAMTVDELRLNLPYEFRDFIPGDPEEYLYDYAVDEIIRDDEGQVVRLELYAAAASRALVETYDVMLKKAGFKLKMVTPAPMAYARLLKNHAQEFPVDADDDVVLIDIGHADVTISLFRGQKYDSARTIDFGCDEFDRIIAEIKGIDPYTASSYKFTNFEDVLNDPACLSLCDRFAVEVAKVVNFYNFNNPDSEINKLCFLGGGASIEQLTSAIAQAVPVQSYSSEWLLPQATLGQPNGPVCALAVGAMLEGGAM